MNPMLLADDHVDLDERLTWRLAAGDFTRDAARDDETALANARATSGP